MSLRTPHLATLVGLTLFGAATLLVGNAAAYPHQGQPWAVTQPDGSRVDVTLWGDEFYVRAESTDGYTLIQDPDTGWFCYAMLADSGELRSTGLPYVADGQSLGVGHVNPELEWLGIPKGLREGDALKE